MYGNYNRSFSPYGSFGNQRSNYNNNYRNFRQGGNFKVSGKRRSHVKTITKNGVVYLSGWKIGRKAGFRTFFVSPAKSPVTRVSKSGKTWVSCKVSVTNKTQGTSGLFPAWWHKETNRVFVKALGLMLNPQSGFISYLSKRK